MTFYLGPPGEEEGDEPSVEEIVEKLRQAIENGTFVIPLPDGTTITPDFFITYYDMVTPEIGKCMMNIIINIHLTHCDHYVLYVIQHCIIHNVIALI